MMNDLQDPSQCGGDEDESKDANRTAAIGATTGAAGVAGASASASAEQAQAHADVAAAAAAEEGAAAAAALCFVSENVKSVKPLCLNVRESRGHLRVGAVLQHVARGLHLDLAGRGCHGTLGAKQLARALLGSG